MEQLSANQGNKQFELPNKADELLELTLVMCGKSDDHCPRFPKCLYDGYVSEILRTATKIHHHVILANEMPRGEYRAALQKEAAGECVVLNHLIRTATYKGWISEKQRDTWQKLVTSVRWKILGWIKSDAKKT